MERAEGSAVGREALFKSGYGSVAVGARSQTSGCASGHAVPGCCARWAECRVRESTAMCRRNRAQSLKHTTFPSFPSPGGTKRPTGAGGRCTHRAHAPLAPAHAPRRRYSTHGAADRAKNPSHAGLPSHKRASAARGCSDAWPCMQQRLAIGQATPRRGTCIQFRTAHYFYELLRPLPRLQVHYVLVRRCQILLALLALLAIQLPGDARHAGLRCSCVGHLVAPLGRQARQAHRERRPQHMASPVQCAGARLVWIGPLGAVAVVQPCCCFCRRMDVAAARPASPASHWDVSCVFWGEWCRGALGLARRGGSAQEVAARLLKLKLEGWLAAARAQARPGIHQALIEVPLLYVLAQRTINLNNDPEARTLFTPRAGRVRQGAGPIATSSAIHACCAVPACLVVRGSTLRGSAVPFEKVWSAQRSPRGPAPPAGR